MSKITVVDYHKKIKADASQDMMLALSEFERGLLQTLERIEIRGKRGRTVPVLLSEEMNEWIEFF